MQSIISRETTDYVLKLKEILHVAGIDETKVWQLDTRWRHKPMHKDAFASLRALKKRKRKLLSKKLFHKFL